MSELGLSFDDESNMYAALQLTDPYGQGNDRDRQLEFLEQKGLSEAQINKAVTHARGMKGVLIGLSASVATQFPIVDCSPDDGWKIETQNGLPFQFVEGIRFLGHQDEQLFRQNLTQ